MDFNSTDATFGSSVDCESTTTTDSNDSVFKPRENETAEKCDGTWNFSTNFHDNQSNIIDRNWNKKQIDIINKIQKSLDKSSKLKNSKEATIYEKSSTSESNANKSQGAIIVKESYIEPPRINRVSRSFHGKTLCSVSCNEIANCNRRASDNPSNYSSVSQPSNLNLTYKKNNENDKAIRSKRHKVITQLSQPNDSLVQKQEIRKTSLTNEATRSMRFTTVKVDEDAHAASSGYINKDKLNVNQYKDSE